MPDIQVAGRLAIMCELVAGQSIAMRAHAVRLLAHLRLGALFSPRDSCMPRAARERAACS